MPQAHFARSSGSIVVALVLAAASLPAFSQAWDREAFKKRVEAAKASEGGTLIQYDAQPNYANWGGITAYFQRTLRYRFPGKALLEELILIPLSLPGISVAVALIGTYGVIRNSWTIILMGHLLYTLPFMLQSVTATLRSYNYFELERAAASLGASAWQRVRYILLPNLRHALVVGSLLVFTISLGEFNASFLLATPENQPLPAALYDSYTNDSFQVSSAATSIFMAVVIPVLLGIQFLGGREMREVGQAA